MGNRYRAELIMALALAAEPGVCLAELAQASGAAPNVYLAPMRALVEAELVEKLPAAPGDRRRWYRRRGAAETWNALGQLVERLSGYGSSDGVSPGPEFTSRGDG